MSENSEPVFGFILQNSEGELLAENCYWSPNKEPYNAWVHPGAALGPILSAARKNNWESVPQKLYAAAWSDATGVIIIDAIEIPSLANEHIEIIGEMLYNALESPQRLSLGELPYPPIAKYGITNAAVEARMVDVRKAISASDAEIRKIAINYLCAQIQELTRYGAKITWQ